MVVHTASFVYLICMSAVVLGKRLRGSKLRVSGASDVGMGFRLWVSI